ncbi:hypothetical protein PLESTB_000623600 [Pleodorina starrii]|uniref:Serine aminopeptidase S33 domain-containing protein n=1 Tax=Pleodorina starrii TaxID=330485 RepID=A0A9W6BIF3_9CHLO|nr:hypothetical protein PLESTM_001728800 [Pleodorina starrii]GLC52388.1 hypothetical protein PLESTB_000623600 [Pleodorina starrii]
MPGLGALWDSLVDCICRPPRDEYIYPDELVGGSRKLFRVGKYPGIREDLTLTNKRGLLLQCSHYLPRHVRGKDGRLPCVVYCHCNSGSRRDAEEAICVLIPCGVSVFTLDFAGSGLSDGQWVTLGAEEVDDVATAVEHLRAGGRVSTLGLWGRSMGAVTALLYSQRDPSIAGMVLDSPFARLTDLMLEIVQEQRLPIPRPLAKLALAAMKRSVMKRAGFDITKVSPVDAVSQSFIPALFGHATGDTFIRITHAEALHEAYAGDKNLIRFEGDHNSRRPEFFYNSVSIFWHNTLQLEHLLEPADLGAATAHGPSSALGTTAGSSGSSSSRHGAGRALRPPPARLRHPQSNPALSADPAAAGAAGTADGGGGGPASAAGAANGPAAAAGAGGAEEDEGVDVTGMAARSAPWEPRLWETDADKAAREKQRFRRMAGGLPSPAHAPDGSSAAADGPLGTAGFAAAGGAFRTSSELARFFATASDESLAARLLGTDPQWLDGAAATTTAPGPVTAAAAPPPPSARLVSSLMAAAMLLPETEEEEEAQLAAALELSLLEAAADDKLLPASAAAAVVPPPGAAAATASGASRPLASGAAGAFQEGGVAHGRIDAAVRSTAAATPSPMYPDAQAAGSSQAAAVAPAAAGTAVTAATVQEASSTAAAVLSGRSNSHEDARAGPFLGLVPSAALSGPAHPGQQQQPEAAGAGAPAVTALLDAAAADDARAAAAAAPEVPPAKPQDGHNGGPRGSGRSPPGPPSAGHSRHTVVGAPGGAAAAARGQSVYDLYTEDELLDLAVRLSLQESAARPSAAATTAPPAAPTPASGGGTVGAAGSGSAANSVPSLM